jgi:hypothetical protein
MDNVKVALFKFSMTIWLKKIILGCFLLSLAAQTFASALVVCHDPTKSLPDPGMDTGAMEHASVQDQQAEHPTTQSDCCSSDCDMGSCSIAVLPNYYSLSSPEFPVTETTYSAAWSDQQIVSLFRPPIIH